MLLFSDTFPAHPSSPGILVGLALGTVCISVKGYDAARVCFLSIARRDYGKATPLRGLGKLSRNLI